MGSSVKKKENKSRKLIRSHLGYCVRLPQNRGENKTNRLGKIFYDEIKRKQTSRPENNNTHSKRKLRNNSTEITELREKWIFIPSRKFKKHDRK